MTVAAAMGWAVFDEPGVVLPGYGIASAGVSRQMRSSMEIDVGMRNLFNRAYPQLVAGGLVSLGEPRAVYLTLHARTSVTGG